VNSNEASEASINAGYERRWADWKLQERLAEKELKQIDKQIAAAQIRQQIAETELTNHEKQIDDAREIETYLKGKYTNFELYEWMKGQIAEVYFQSYQLAYDLARGAERGYQHEIGIDASFIKFGYWDSLKKGLLAGEKLYHDLRRMEAAYHTQNRREYEITKHVSLLLNDPLALLELKTTGRCEVELPEMLFDADYPGHYFRRIKNVSLSIPCVVGPYTSINCTLTLLNSKVRVKPSASSSPDPKEDYSERDSDRRFTYDHAPLQRIATSHGQTDTGLFELNFRDERYLPFEGAGAISTWRIDLPIKNNAFDLDSVSDVILTIRYSAQEGGELLRSAASNSLSAAIMSAQNTILHRLFSARHEFPDQWYRFLHSATSGTSQLSLPIDKDRFPYLFRAGDLTLTYTEVLFFVKLSSNGSKLTKDQLVELKLTIKTPLATEAVQLDLNPWKDSSAWLSAHLLKPGELAGEWSEILDIDKTVWTIDGMDTKFIDDVLILVEYTVSETPTSSA
jgi:hypothetical protein